MKLQESLKAFVDGETRDGESLLIKKYLEESPEAQKEIDDLNRLTASIRAYVTQPEPVGLEATLTALEKAKPSSRRTVLVAHQLRWVGAFAAGVLVIGLVASHLGHSESDNASGPLGVGPANLKLMNTPAIANAPSGIVGSGARSGDIAKTSPSDGAFLRDSAKAYAGESVGTPGGSANEGINQNGAGAFGGRVGNHGNPMGVSGTVPYSSPRPIDGQFPSSKGNDQRAAEDRFEEGAPVPTTPPSTHAKTPGTRSLIQKTAALNVKVKDVAESQQTVEGIAVSLGGYVQQSSRNEAEGEKGEANLTVRVPVQNYDAAIKRIRGLGDVISDSSTGNDVTADVVDMDARMKVLKAEESDYMVLLGRARSIAAIMEIKDKLTEIREEIESIDGQRKSTKDLAEYSTINVQLTQRSEDVKPVKPEEDKGWLTNTWTTAVDGLGSAGKVIAQLFIFVLVWSPLWIPVALLSAWLYRRNKW